MEGTEILHGKFLLECNKNATEKVLAGSSENNVVHIKEQICHVSPVAVDEQRSV
jgi:hypothetical protein